MCSLSGIRRKDLATGKEDFRITNSPPTPFFFVRFVLFSMTGREET